MKDLEDRQERIDNLKGMGCSRKRVEDARFTQGKGNYVDDVNLPGMLHGDFVRSPYAHARVKSINIDAAMALDGVVAVLTAKDLEPLALHWMPTLAGDKQMVLADGKVLFQGQEVAFVVAKDRYIAADAVELVEVEYEELPVLVDPFEALQSDVVLREDIKDEKEGAHGPRRHHNHIFLWEEGDKEATEQVFDEAEVVAEEMVYYHRTHPCPLEPCGSVASMDKINGKLTLWGTFQAPHVVRTVASLLSGIEEHNIRVISPDIGGGFGNKVGVYPGYVCSIVATIVTGQPVKWIEDRMENLMATAFARDYWMKGKISATKEGKITGLQCHVTADHGAFDACADPTKFPAGFFHICTGSYDIPVAYVGVDGVYTNKAPGGVAYRCSFRVTEAAYFIERMIEVLAMELNMDAAELRRINFIKADQFPYQSALGWEYDSGDYHTAWDKALAAVGYDDLRAEQAQRVEDFKAGKTRKLLGIGLTHFTEIVGAGPVKNCDILGMGMFDSCEIRIHPTGSAIARLGTISQGQGHATTFAQILASEIGLSADSITIEEGDTDTAPYGLGTYGSRSTPVAGAATAMAGRKIRAKAQMIAAYLLEVHDNDLEWDVDRFVVKGAPERFKTMKDIAYAAYNQAIPGVEPGLEAVSYYDPPNMTYPFGAYICVMEVDVDTGEHEIRQFYALDDCGTRINPMVIEGQVHGGLTEALAIAMGQEIAYDDMGNCKTGTLMDFFIPTAVETPHYTTDHTETPSPHHPIGAKGVGESPNVGGVPAFSNAVHDAFRAFGLRQSHMPHDHWRIWKIASDLGLHG
ncbi:aerobic carbon-monoxide dehydrogenase large subunit [Phaeobacter gallaeciensis]|uniref:aerobic carbon-monoxide dehydrogenase large subunit n=1 Tax=Phaeobacter gallaeciensis TaxID=60890 RepID=UPI00237F310E|nr:aerobic carbon-monoxide dehydrogenase large subunit [Phaeobacter gallaeciensis]MDE4189544.1 aerobic carbon-monoxide dehydrogenase large subunit [Phaeobacter gallaeciensis]MDE4198696.1 aerobic carbon-monoxide dehydrogenase large subunit [Phaeobacter gallaeciensis]MDE4202841.1 aerobic carbon-monoxide dehydrogenase large subunit [Phaeobacter gallaeciensis]MDE4206985.1 aerobic carbon-monoxide dehydrogenase large subunit [Phaeobacter gallaeciensis]MDE4215790.1 aerobic carbon-monoxide dehydrogena